MLKKVYDYFFTIKPTIGNILDLSDFSLFFNERGAENYSKQVKDKIEKDYLKRLFPNDKIEQDKCLGKILDKVDSHFFNKTQKILDNIDPYKSSNLDDIIYNFRKITPNIKNLEKIIGFYLSFVEKEVDPFILQNIHRVIKKDLNIIFSGNSSEKQVWLDKIEILHDEVWVKKIKDEIELFTKLSYDQKLEKEEQTKNRTKSYIEKIKNEQEKEDMLCLYKSYHTLIF